MSVLQAIQNRRSVRAYVPGNQVTDEQVHELLEAAMLAPSACNMRPWEFAVVRDRGKMDAMRQLHPYARMLESAALAIVVCGAPDDRNAIARPFFPQDCAAATQNMLIQAVSMGLGTCWCGIYPHEGRSNQLRTLLDLPDHLIPFNIVAVGVPSEGPPSRGQFDDSKVHQR
jgi:nitroreductase